MKLPRVRLTVRTMMVVLLVIGVSVHLAVTAWRVREQRARHLHTGIMVDDRGRPGTFFGVRTETFWPAYCRRLTGFSWRESCGFAGKPPHSNLLAEKCELDNPEVRKPGPPHSFARVLTGDQIDLYLSLAKKAGLNVRYENGSLVHRLPVTPGS